MNSNAADQPAGLSDAHIDLDATRSMSPDDQASQLANILDRYLAGLQAGCQPDRQKLLAEHPELASQLESCLSGIEFIHRASAPLSPSGTPNQLGDFRIVREVGRGGMGVVYEAEQISLKRRVALKVLRYGAAADTEAMQRFQREAETVAGLHHTNIVPIFAIGSEQGVNYYAMQFIEGRSLADFRLSIDDFRLSDKSEIGNHQSKIAGWGLQAAEALAHAHQRGVVHRDIKPSNLILDPDGRLWLTDFGLAKRQDDVTLSMAGAILGTPRYMSPEQASSLKHPVDHRTDIYSLGATLYELITGRPVFDAETAHGVITQILNAVPPAPRLVRPDVPRDFETIILKCLAKEPSQRYVTAQALADDLRAFVEGRAIKARRATLAEQAARWFKQQKRSVGIAVTAVAATIAVVVGSLIAWQMHGQSRLGYLTLNTPRDGGERAEVAEVLSLDDRPVGSPFTLPTKEPLALPEGAYRLRLTAPSKVSQTYLFDVSAGVQQTHEVGLVNETVGYAISLRSPVGVAIVQSSPAAPRQDSQMSTGAVRANDPQSTKNQSENREGEVPAEPRTSKKHGSAGASPSRAAGSRMGSKNTDPAPGFPVAERQGYVEPRLFVGPQDQSKPTLRCYSANSQPGWKPDGSRETEVAPLFEANWSLEAPDIISFLKLPADREAWKVLPAQTDVFAWQQVLAWFDPWWFRHGTPPKVMQPARDLNGDGVADVIWLPPTLAHPESSSGPGGPMTPKAAVLVAASGKDGQPLWWFRPQDSQGSASRLSGVPVWCGESLVAVMHSAVNEEEMWIEAVSPRTGESLWRLDKLTAFAPGTTIMLRTSNASERRYPSTLLTQATLEDKPVVIAVIGNQLLVLDAATGEPRRPARVLPGYAYSARFADLDADGFPEALLTFMDQSGSPQFAAFSVDRGEPLWDTKVGIDSLQFQRTMSSLPWPFVEDLDGDGRPEVVLPGDGDSGDRTSSGRGQAWTGCRVLEGATGKTRWERRFPFRYRYYGPNLHRAADQYAVGPDLNGDGQRELFTASMRQESQMQVVNRSVGYQRDQYFLYVDCFSGRDGQSVWWQRIPLGLSEYSTWTGTPDAPILWGGVDQFSRNALESGSPEQEPDASAFRLIRSTNPDAKLVLPVRRHADQGGGGIGNAGARLLFVLSAETGRIEHQAEDIAFPQLVDWNNDGLDDLAVFVPDDPQRFANGNWHPDKPSGKFVVLRGSPPEAFRRLDRWVEEQDFDGDGFAELSQRSHGNGDYAIQIASGRDGHITSHRRVEWPETPRSWTVGDVQTFPSPQGDFDGDGLADLLVSRMSQLSDFDTNAVVARGKVPLLVQTISGKTGRRIWGGGSLSLPDWIRPTDADENSQSRHVFWSGRFQPTLTDAVDLDGDGRGDVLHLFSVSNDSQSKTTTGSREHRRQLFAARLDGRDGTLRWAEPYQDQMAGESWLLGGDSSPQLDASADLNGDGTRDLVLTTPQKSQQGSWFLNLQVQSGRDGKVLWGPKPLEGMSFNNNDFKAPIISDLDGDGRAEIVLMPSKQPHVTVLRGDTGEQLWTWEGTQPQFFAAPGIAVVAQLSRHAPRDESRSSVDAERANDAHPTKIADTALGSPHAEREGYVGLRCVAVAFNETGSQWNLVLLDHTGQELEKIPCQSNQLWSQDLDGDGDGDGGEELLWSSDTIKATRGLHDVLWTWSPPPQSYGSVSHIERTADGRVIVGMGSNDSVTLLDGKTGKPLGRTWASCNTSINENGRMLNLIRPKLNSAGESPRLLTRVGEGPTLFGHVVSRAVLPTSDDGKYASRMDTLARPAEMENQPTRTGKSAHPTNDPRLIRRLPWAPSAGEQSSSSLWTMMLLQTTRAILLSLVVVLIPFWLIRAGVRRRELGWWRGALIFSGLTVFLASLSVIRFAPPGSIWRDAPWALPFAMAVGGLAILAWPTTFVRSVWLGKWQRVRWQLGGTLLFALAEMLLALWVDSATKSPEQHYSWHGWWFILLLGAYGVGSLLVLWRVFGPGVLWLWKFGRRRFARHA